MKMIVRNSTILSLVVLAITVLMASCCLEKREFYEADGNARGQIKYLYQQNVITKEKCGRFIWFADTGDTIQSTTFNNGKLNGISRYYFEGNHIQLSIEAVNDLKHGTVKEYFQNGQMKIECTYNLNGLWNIHRTYDQDGNLLNSGSLENGTGKVFGYYPNGKLKHVGGFKNGYRDGKWLFYTDNGILMDSTIYVNGLTAGSPDAENSY